MQKSGYFVKKENKAAYSLYALTLAAYFFFAPFEDVLNSSVGTLAKYLALLAVGCMFLYYLYGIINKNAGAAVRTSVQYENVLLLLLPILLVLLSWLSYIWAYDSEVTFSRNITYTLLPFLFLAIMTVNFDKDELLLIKRLAIVGGICATLYMFYTLGLDAVFEGRLTIDEENDPNNLAALILTPLALSLDEFVKAKKPLYKVLYLGAVVLLAFTLLLTGSRGGMLAFATFLLAYFGADFLKTRNKKRVILFICIVLVVLIAATFLPTEIFARLFYEDSYNALIEQEGNRVVLWGRCFTELVPNMPLWGWGSGNNTTKLSEIFGQTKGVHNTYISLLLEYGILGLPLFIWFIAAILRRLYKRNGVCETALVLALLVVIIFLDAYAKKFLWNTLFLAAIYLKTKDSKEKTV